METLVNSHEQIEKTQQTTETSLTKYREQLVNIDQSILTSYAKTLISLSSGALGVSITFVNNMIKPPQHIQEINSLFISWFCWIGSLTFILFSFYCSHRALRKAMKQCDDGKLMRLDFDDREPEKVGGYWTLIINFLNPVSGLVFLIGMGYIIHFALHNVRQ